MDLIGESVFANFGALNSGMYIADPSISCSLNCNGECDVFVQAGVKKKRQYSISVEKIKYFFLQDYYLSYHSIKSIIIKQQYSLIV